MNPRILVLLVGSPFTSAAIALHTATRTTGAVDARETPMPVFSIQPPPPLMFHLDEWGEDFAPVCCRDRPKWERFPFQDDSFYDPTGIKARRREFDAWIQVLRERERWEPRFVHVDRIQVTRRPAVHMRGTRSREQRDR